VVRDPLGSFVLAPAEPSREGREGQKGQRGTQGATAPNLRVSWRTFENTFGAKELAQDRMPREVKRRGAGREKRWEEFRAAIENYVVGVKPGNQTALNAAADPFAAYLAAFHRNLHMEFAHQFLESLPAVGDLGDPNLVTKVEIVVNPDGTLDRVGVVKSSGNLMYDFGAFNAVQRGSPYPAPPEKIRSPDGRVYMRWALHRNESQCGTWNAEPYILKNPPRSPNDPKPDNVSPYDTEKGRKPAAPGTAPRAGETMGQLEGGDVPSSGSTASRHPASRAM
jgi:TonB family protein